MSDPESPDGVAALAREPRTVEAFTRWRGLLPLTLGVVAGPAIALANEQWTYAVNMWACGHDARAAIHVVPMLCLTAIVGAGLTAFRAWRAVGRGVEDEEATVATRTRFVALLGMAASAFATLVVIAQWAAVFVFHPCARV